MPPEIIADLYRAFANIPRPQQIEGCPCCVDDKEIHTLLTKELAAITPDEMGSYASSVFLTVGSEEDFPYFLPRILEILSSDFAWWPDPEVVGRAIGTFGWEKFSPAQKEALSAFCRSVLSVQIYKAELSGGDIDSWLCCFSHFLPAWEECLQQVERCQAPLLALYEWHSASLSRGHLGNGFWDDSPRKEDFKRWLTRLVDDGTISAVYGL